MAETDDKTETKTDNQTENKTEEKLKSNSFIIDQLLGGYEKDIITTIYGPAGSGKTTLCLLASISASQLGKKIIFVDTEGGFSLTRFNQLINQFENKELLKNIFILKPTTFNDQHKAIERLNNMVNESIGLIVVDTIGMLYRVEIGKKQAIKEINNMLSIQLNLLTEITRKYNIPVILTNQVYSDFDERNAIKIVGGDIITYASKCLLELKKGANNVRVAIVRKHRSIPDGKEAKFKIVEDGFGAID
ncbi:DNA repair and recombination protein RadB [Candidatus Woesearchaeota archaeon]|nr:DNA repair and recombination protein RadB [Candidatus Woesearchaeota archaeon]